MFFSFFRRNYCLFRIASQCASDKLHSGLVVLGPLSQNKKKEKLGRKATATHLISSLP